MVSSFSEKVSSDSLLADGSAPFKEPLEIIAMNSEPTRSQIATVQETVSKALTAVAGKKVFNKSEYDFIEKALSWLGTKDPNNETLYQLQLAEVYQATKKYKECLNLFKNILNIHPKAKSFRNRSARVLEKMGLYKLSCKVFNRAINKAQNEIIVKHERDTVQRIGLIRFSPAKDLEKEERISLSRKPEVDHKDIRRDFIFDNINYGTDHIERQQLNVPDGWTRSDYFRGELRKATESLSEYLEALENTKITAPVNFRYQSLEIDGKKESGFFRLGVITDHRNGFTNYKQLKYFKENENAKNCEIVRLQALQQQYKKDSPEYLSIRFAIGQLNNIEQTIISRREILEKQMLQLVQAQALKHPDEVIGEKKLSIVHLSLLNPTKEQLDATGWAHFEKNEMEDMQEIFAEFNGKKVIFSENGVELADTTDPHAVTISTIFFNISVQGHLKNDGEQNLINKKALEKVDSFIKTDEEKRLFQQIKNDLEQGKSSYKVAEDISTLLMILKVPTSMGCLSAKDRTGYVAFRTQCRMLERKLDTAGLTIKQKERLATHFGSQGLSAKGAASAVVEDNTKCRFLKVSPLKLPGLSESVVLRLKRLRDLFKAAISMIKIKK